MVQRGVCQPRCVCVEAGAAQCHIHPSPVSKLCTPTVCKRPSGRQQDPPLQLGEPATAVHLPAGHALQAGAGLAAVPASDVVPWGHAVHLGRPRPAEQMVTANRRGKRRLVRCCACSWKDLGSKIWGLACCTRTIAGGRPLGGRRLVGRTGLAAGLGDVDGAGDRRLPDGARATADGALTRGADGDWCVGGRWDGVQR